MAMQPIQMAPEEVFLDAFAQGAIVAQNSMIIKETPFFEKVHAVANVAALLAIIIFVALQRNKNIELSSFFLKETQLKRAFDTLC